MNMIQKVKNTKKTLVYRAIAFAALSVLPHSIKAVTESSVQFIIFNRMPGVEWNQARPETITRRVFEEVTSHFPKLPHSRIKIGIAYIISYHKTNDASTVNSLKRLLRFSQETGTPILIKLDGECWWQGRPDLWNWWDPDTPGYDPANRQNVEWTDWSPEHAIKIAWRNWGHQIRILPPPNLMSPRYRRACHEKMVLLLPIIATWRKSLPDEQKDLLVGINVGWESSIGVNAWYYPGGNDLFSKPPDQDPRTGLDTQDVTSRGQVQIGYAAVKTAGIRNQGAITERDLYEVIRRHLEDLSRKVFEFGFPREKIFTHGAAWKEEELLYNAAVNKYSCPGWSFYRYAHDPGQDKGIRRALKLSDAKDWAAVEWLLMKPYKIKPWRDALANTLIQPRCRFLCIYNWEQIRKQKPVLEAIRQIMRAGIKSYTR